MLHVQEVKNKVFDAQSWHPTGTPTPEHLHLPDDITLLTNPS